MATLFALLLLLGDTFPISSDAWIDGPEAYFATESERTAWSALSTADAQAAFIERYWLLRDPTPGSIRNEFRETIMGRIRYADGAFGFDEVLGSRTARGFLFIVFGSPSRAKEWSREREVDYLWTWDRDRTPDLVKALGVPRLEIFVTREIRQPLERLHQAAFVDRYRRILADRSITNPGLTAPAAVPYAEFIPSLTPTDEPGPAPTLTPGGAAVVFTLEGEPRTLVWGHQQHALTEPLAVAVPIEDGGGRTRVWTGGAIESGQLHGSKSQRVWLTSLSLPPGSWKARIGGDLVDLTTPARGTFAVSSILLGGIPGSEMTNPLFVMEAASFPRADARFSRSESLWYFLQFRGAVPEGTRLEPKLMKKGKGIVTAWQPFAPDLVAAGSNLQVAGYEVPLQTIEPGAYTLYVTIRAGGESLIRRADFEVVER